MRGFVIFLLVAGALVWAGKDYMKKKLDGLTLSTLESGTPEAAAEKRVLITNDRNTMVGFAHQRVAVGEPMPGLIVTTNEQAIGLAIEDILVIAEYMPEEEIRDQVVVFLPLR